MFQESDLKEGGTEKVNIEFIPRNVACFLFVCLNSFK